MTVFWLSAIAVLAFTLVLVLTPLLSSRHNDATQEAGTASQRPWPWLVFIAVFIVVGSVFLYTRSPGYHSMKSFYAGQHQAEQLAIQIDAFEQQLQQQGGHHDQWLELASMRVLLQQPEQAVVAYRSAERLAPIDDVDALLNFGAALLHGAASQPKQLNEALVLFERVLAQAPDQQMALWYVGQVRFELADFAGAVKHWQLLLHSIKEDSQAAQAIRTELGKRLAAARAHLPADHSEARPDNSIAADPAGTSFAVRVRLAPALQNRINPQDTLFVYARAVAGPPMPLAIKRLTAAELPVTVQLSNRDAMLPSMNLDSFPRLEIVARISASGQAQPQAGDLIAVSTPQTATTKKQTIDLLINQVFHP